MYLDAMVEDERRVAKWKEWKGREAAHKALWTQFQLAAVALNQLYIREGDAGEGVRPHRPSEGRTCLPSW